MVQTERQVSKELDFNETEQNFLIIRFKECKNLYTNLMIYRYNKSEHMSL